mmetsp:Transcript_30830/g.52190  ORF Transcript_30830/g.52190 Transcript_30830/m.52190 type:complete len:89 (-) Transcript_30830:806-1072(-)
MQLTSQKIQEESIQLPKKREMGHRFSVLLFLACLLLLVFSSEHCYPLVMVLIEYSHNEKRYQIFNVKQYESSCQRRIHLPGVTLVQAE